MVEELRIQSYFSLPTDLAAEMRAWPEFVSGEGYTVNLSDVMISLQKASINVQATVQGRNTLVQAYHDLMNMQV